VDGIGIAYTLLDFVEEEIRAGRLVLLLEDWTPRIDGFYLYYPSRRQVPAPLQAFVEFLKKERRLARIARR
jgi:DNA-binding transcriptional LysR family regulator